MPTQLLVGPNAPSGKKTTVLARSPTLLKISAMDFGIGYFPTADAVGPGELAAFVEERGFSSLVFAEHTHIPASRESPYPGGGELPRKYTATLDLFVALTAAALATSRLRVGSGISLVIQRDPIITAKEVASIDVLSGGRFDFGVGAGWNREEMEHHGTDPRTRMRLLAERVEAMKALWTEREATFHGEFVDFDRVLLEPKPVQRPHPPVLVGGLGPTVIDRVLAFGDAWFPNWTPDITDRAAELASRAERPIDFMAMGPPADPKVLERLAEADTRLVSWWLPSGGYSVIEPELEKVERAIAEFHGEA
jgi:probable F420-dependent oxidoreductase